ncbi:MAG: hypothetical protein K2H94_08905, partial [Duncaniella sp.]|nr:hypothetical protein [Duncaniella sp.]
ELLYVGKTELSAVGVLFYLVVLPGRGGSPALVAAERQRKDSYFSSILLVFINKKSNKAPKLFTKIS